MVLREEIMLCTRSRLALISTLGVALASMSVAGAMAQTCATKLGKDCPTAGELHPQNACIQPGQLFIKESDKWRIAGDQLPKRLSKELEFFYALNGEKECARNFDPACRKGYGVLFVGIQEEDTHRGAPLVTLSVNKGLPFEKRPPKDKTEAKQEYQDTILKKRAVSSDNTRAWLSLRALDLGTESLLNLLNSETLSQLDYPVGISRIDRRLHSRLYRYERGSTSCIHFQLGRSKNLARLIIGLLDLSAENDELQTPEMVRVP
jgi:hypothetical protein